MSETLQAMDRKYSFLSPDFCSLAQGGNCKPFGRLHDLNGKVERSQKTNKSEFYATVDIDSEDI
ncbi:hypothetical protein AS4_05910 [Acinetobacter guillouiae]|nr:hypothetical protein AS4_05910 [Acinetobacter guillouiae]